MSFNRNQFPGYIPSWLNIPEDPSLINEFLNTSISGIVDAVNSREIAVYRPSEIFTGQIWFNENNTNRIRNGFRTVVNFGSLPNTTTKSVGHGIANINSNFVLTHLFGSASDTSALTYIPLPYVEVSTGNNIQIDMDAANVNITTLDNKSSYDKCYVIIEYLRSK